MHPFHRISRWNGTCFTPSSLSNAGLTLNLGHFGRLCPTYRRQVQQTTGQETHSQTSQTNATDVPSQSSPDDIMMTTPCGSDTLQLPLTSKERRTDANMLSINQEPSESCPLPSDNGTGSNTGSAYSVQSGQRVEQVKPLGNIDRFWEIAGTTPYEMRNVVGLGTGTRDQPLSPDGIPANLSKDPFFANESEEEEGWKDINRGGLPLKIKHDNRKYDKLHCPLLIVVDTTGIHEMRVRFCQCQSLEDNPMLNQLMSMGLYASSSKRTRTVFTFRVLHHFDITNLEGKTTAWQYYCTLKRLTSNVFADTVSDRYRELMRALRQWRDLSSRRRAGVPLDPGVELNPGGLALFCPACPQPGINLPPNWDEDKEQFVSYPFLRLMLTNFTIDKVEIHAYDLGRRKF